MPPGSPHVGALDSDASRWMRLAVELGWRRWGLTSPNPAVGAVVVREGRVVGAGFHRAAGCDHAEALALARAGTAARGADLYVTLEPCNHHGRTPPCTRAIVDAGVSRVFVGARDPNAEVAGGGNAWLRAQGVEVVEGIEAVACRQLARPFVTVHELGIPLVIVKLAATLDGRVGHPRRPRAPISGRAAREWVHRLRSRVDAVLVGAGTARLDRPSLSARPYGRLRGHQPLRVVVDSGLQTPADAPYAGPGAVVLAAKPSASDAKVRRFAARGTEVLTVPPDESGRVCLRCALRALAARGCHTVLCEGGPRLATALLRSGLAGSLAWVTAPWAAGSAWRAALGPGAAESLGAGALRDVRVWRTGDDAVIVGDLEVRPRACVHASN